MESKMTLVPVGRVRINGDAAWIDIDPQYRDAMVGLDGFSHIHVLFWFHENDTRESRATRQVRPCRNPSNPVTGVFATHSPLRPNLIGLTLCRITAIDGLRIHLAGIDARDNSPVVDIKCYIPPEAAAESIRVPQWV